MGQAHVASKPIDFTPLHPLLLLVLLHACLSAGSHAMLMHDYTYDAGCGRS